MSVLDGPRQEWRRILHEGQARWVRPEGDRLRLPEGQEIAEQEATYLPPCAPTKIICVHVNYASRFRELHGNATPAATYFHKPISALNAHRGLLNKPADCKLINYEGEIAVIVGKPMRNVAPAEAWDYIAGFAPGNDVGVHDFRETDSNSMLRVKGMDGMSPIGPGIVSGVDIRQSRLRTYLNGRVVQEDMVEGMLFGIDYMLADLSRHITLMPGDVLLSGTPANSRPMAVGDLVEVEVSGVGRLSNRVNEIPAPAHKVGHQPTDSDAVRRVALGSDFKPR